MTTSILCTIGPASLNEWTLRRLEDLGVSLFRVNLSHTATAAVRPAIEFMQKHAGVPVCLDSEGAQVRTGDFAEAPTTLKENSVVRVHRRRVPGDARDFNLTPDDIIDLLQVGDFISIDFNSVLAQVIGIGVDFATLRVLTGGAVGRNKAVTVERDIPLPAITDKDRLAIAIGREMGVRHYALSFANRAEDVDEMRSLAGTDAFIISKIESRSGLLNLEDIARRSNAILIDRGDLSRQVPIEQIPGHQKDIIRRAKAVSRPVYVATNLLESMVTSPMPTRAEVNDIYNTLADGADGLVLAAETAIGQYPVRCVGMVAKVIHEFRTPRKSSDAGQPASLLVPPHGGQLIERSLPVSEAGSIARLPRVAVGETALMDAEQIALGTYSPLDGFMDSATLESVLRNHALPDGTVWTMPIILQVPAETARRHQAGDRIALGMEDGEVHAVLDVTQSYEIDLPAVAKQWFGTDSQSHPGVARLMKQGPHVLAGKVTLAQRLPSPYRHYELTPAQTRFIFAQKGWSRVVGFHGRNVVHRAHEHIQLEALHRSEADGLYISPVIGPKKAGDFLPEPIMRSYQVCLDSGVYPAGKVVLGSFATFSRFCGPREAVFTALCRKNMGCSHFIIGRDHTGVGDFYAPDDNRRLFERLGDIGITPVFFGAVGYNPESGKHEEGNTAAQVSISGTEIRRLLLAGKPVPDWCMRDIVQDMLLREVAAGRDIVAA